MGLDMYLDRHIYNRGKWEKQENDELKYIRGEVTLKGKVVPEVKTLICDFGYWRKANAIHRWFVENIQDGCDDCKTYYVATERLVELRELCKQVLADHSLAEELLPTQDGFFFGGTEYDDWYFKGLEYTVELLDGIEQSGDDYYYHSSW